MCVRACMLMCVRVYVCVCVRLVCVHTLIPVLIGFFGIYCFHEQYRLKHLIMDSSIATC